MLTDPETMPSLAWRRARLVLLCAAIGFTCGAAAGVAYGWVSEGPERTIEPGLVTGLSLASLIKIGTVFGGVPGTLNGLVLSALISELLLKKPMPRIWPWLLLPALITAIAVAASLGAVAAWILSSIVLLVSGSVVAANVPDLSYFSMRACVSCGYSLEGIRGDVCPECGLVSPATPLG